MSNWTYIFVMAGVTMLIRLIPMLFLKKPIENRFFRSFLYYVPYVTLAVMTFPAITQATSSPLAGYIALIGGMVAAWLGAGLLPVSLLCCAAVFVSEMILL